jgi:hypothetical protein
MSFSPLIRQLIDSLRILPGVADDLLSEWFVGADSSAKLLRGG